MDGSTETGTASDHGAGGEPPETLRDLGLAIYKAATAFVGTLFPMHKDRGRFPDYAVLPFQSDNRFEWYFLPASLIPRAGLPLRAMNPRQQQAALELLRASLAGEWYQRTDYIRRLEFVLREIEKDQENPFRRESEAYHFTIFGTPSETGTWGWRYEGHHTSLQWTMVNGEVVATTPQFLGTSPAEVPRFDPHPDHYPPPGTRVLGEQEDLARALVNSLDPQQRQEALLVAPVPGEILTVNARAPAIQENRGVFCGSLDADQRELLRKLVEAYATVQRAPVAAARMRRIGAATVGWDGIRFAWTGPVDAGAPPGHLHYYRIFQEQGFLIEYDTPMGEPFHRHTVWRDFNNDWGRDVLAASATGLADLRDMRLGLGPEWGPDLLARHYEAADHHALSDHNHAHSEDNHDHHHHDGHHRHDNEVSYDDHQP